MSDNSLYKEDRGYTRLNVSGEPTVRLHQLAVLAREDVDPADVFDPDNEVHHWLGSLELGVAPDLPANLSVLDRGDHRRIHNNESPEEWPSLVEILAEEHDRAGD